MPPEVNTGRLIAGAGPEPYLQAELGWQVLAVQFTAALTALRTQISVMSSMWQGMASSQAQAAFEPYLAWMETVIAMVQQRSMAAAEQAANYATTVVETPTLAEVATNHLTHAVLEATNFLGVNTFPIGVNEFEYLVVLWNRAAMAMDGYAAATGTTTTFPPFPPAPPIMAAPGAPEAGLAAILASAAATLPATVARDALLAELDVAANEGAVQGRVQQASQLMGSAANMASSAGQQAGQQAGQAGTTESGQTMQMASQMGMQAPQMAAQVPQQMGQMLGQGPQQLFQMASQPMQQITQLFQGMGSSDLAGQNISSTDLLSHFGSTEQLGAYGTSAMGSGGGGMGGAGLLSASNAGASTQLRAPAGWSQPASMGSTDELARTTASASGGGNAVGSGAGGMGPMAGAHGRGEGAGTVLEEPVAEEKAVVTSLGFEVFDDDSSTGL